MSIVLGIDLGTQHLKTLLYDADLRQVLVTTRAPLELEQKSDGSAQQNAAWWVEALHIAMSQIDSKHKKRITAIGVSGQQHGFVPIDEAGEVLAPVKLWCDTSTEQECAEIMDRAGGQASCIAGAGNPVLPGYTASKILWLKKKHQKLYDEMDGILLPHDYLNLYLTGERCMEAGDASGTGCLDVRTRTWSGAMLKAIDPDRDLKTCLPDVVIDNNAIGKLLPTVANELGVPAGIPVSIGGGDNMMAAIGTGNVKEGVVSMSLGTSGTVYAYSDTPVVDPEGEIAAFCSSTGGWLPLLCTMNCTVSTELMRNLLAVDFESFETQIAAAAPGASGVITVPFFNGERTPDLPNAKGCVLGLDSQNTRPENLLRSAVEGATFALRYGIDRLRTLGIEADEIVVTGGGSNSPTWRQIISDVSNTPVTVLQQNEGAAFGAALQAVAMLEKTTDWQSLVAQHLSPDEVRSCEPRSAMVSTYQNLYQQYQGAVDNIAALYR